VLRLTVARYFTPSGRCIQKAYTHGDTDDYDAELEVRRLHGELFSRDSIIITDSTVYRTTSGRKVYGGGGIIPDIFVPVETFRRNPAYMAVIPFANEFLYSYWEGKRNALKAAWPNASAFASGFSFEDAELQNFQRFARSKRAAFTDAQFAEIAPALRNRFKADLARLMFDMEQYYRILEPQDEVLKAAMRAIRDDAYRTRAMSNGE
jgi:carboxyl-terminal processing protease